MSQYVTTCHDMSRCHQRSTGLFSDEWAVLQKEVNGVEDVPCKRTDDARGSWVLQEILVSGDKLDIILFPSKKYLGTFASKKYLGTLPQNMRENRSWSSNHLHSILIYYIYYTFDVQLFLMHPKSFKRYSRRAVWESIVEYCRRIWRAPVPSPCL